MNLTKFLVKYILPQLHSKFYCGRSWDWSQLWLHKRIYICDLLFSDRQ